MKFSKERYARAESSKTLTLRKVVLKRFCKNAYCTGTENSDFLFLNYQISHIIHFELPFPARDVQTCSDFNQPNHQNRAASARETLYPISV